MNVDDKKNIYRVRLQLTPTLHYLVPDISYTIIWRRRVWHPLDPRAECSRSRRCATLPRTILAASPLRTTGTYIHHHLSEIFTGMLTDYVSWDLRRYPPVAFYSVRSVNIFSYYYFNNIVEGNGVFKWRSHIIRLQKRQWCDGEHQYEPLLCRLLWARN